MGWGGVWSHAWGLAQDHILSIKADVYAGKILRVRFTPMGEYRAKFYAVFVNGIWMGNIEAQILGECSGEFMLTPSTVVGSVYVEDAGEWSSFDLWIPKDFAEDAEALTARRLQMQWTAPYRLTTARGDSQLSGITVTGAQRGLNVGTHEEFATRAKLTYSISSVGTTRIVRWWADETLVAEGSRTGNGALTCSEMNDSDLSVTCTLTYTADLRPAQAFIEIKWPSSYQIHYSTSALAYPRTAEETVNDNGSSVYLHLSPVLAAGAYNYNVVPVDDCTPETAPAAPADSPKTLNTMPAAPTGLVVTGTPAALTATWVNGETGCTYTVYASLVNEPINFGEYALPAPIVTGVNATSQVLAAVTGYATASNQAAIDTLFAAFDAAVVTCNTAFGVGQVGFAAAFTTFVDALKSAVTTYGTSLKLQMSGFQNAITSTAVNVSGYAAALPSGMTTANWKNAMGLAYSSFLAFTGDILDHTRGRYLLPNAAVGGGAAGSSTVGTGASPDGSSGETNSGTSLSLWECAQPVNVPGKIRVVVRATKAGVQEKQDAECLVEFDTAGSLLNPRPNMAGIYSYSVCSLVATIKSQVLNDDRAVQAAYVDLYMMNMESKTNLFTRSQEFDHADWVKLNATITTNSVAAPDGTLTAETITDDSAVGARHYANQTHSIIADTTYSLSFFAKAGTKSKIWFLSNRTGAQYTYFNLSTGAVGTTPAGHTATIADAGGGWYRCKVTWTQTGSVTAPHEIGIGIADVDGVPTYTGVGTGTVYIWGGQLEASAYVSSYKATTTVAITAAGATQFYNPQASITLTDPVLNLQSADFSYTVPNSGHYRISAAARSSTGARSAQAIENIIHIDSTAPTAVLSLVGKVMRGRGATNG